MQPIRYSRIPSQLIKDCHNFVDSSKKNLSLYENTHGNVFNTILNHISITILRNKIYDLNRTFPFQGQANCRSQFKFPLVLNNMVYENKARIF